MFRSPAKNANGVLYDPDETLGSEEGESREQGAESAPVTNEEERRARQRRNLDDQQEDEEDQMIGGGSVLGLVEEAGDDMVEEDEVMAGEEKDQDDLSRESTLFYSIFSSPFADLLLTL